MKIGDFLNLLIILDIAPAPAEHAKALNLEGSVYGSHGMHGVLIDYIARYELETDFKYIHNKEEEQIE